MIPTTGPLAEREIEFSQSGFRIRIHILFISRLLYVLSFKIVSNFLSEGMYSSIHHRELWSKSDRPLYLNCWPCTREFAETTTSSITVGSYLCARKIDDHPRESPRFRVSRFYVAISSSFPAAKMILHRGFTLESVYSLISVCFWFRWLHPQWIAIDHRSRTC